MCDVLEHHGILGQKWGVRRTPEQLGHRTASVSSAKTTKNAKDVAKESSTKRFNRMTDDEIQRRINRLRLEKTYDELLMEHKRRNTGTVRKLAGEAFERFGKGLLNKAIDTALNKMFDKDGNFDIDKWRNADVNTMDEHTIKRVTEWYKNADMISQKRKAIKNRESESENRNSAKSTSESKANTNDSPHAKYNNKQQISYQSNSSNKIPWMYREAGTAAKKERDKIERYRDKHDKKEYKWIG